MNTPRSKSFRTSARKKRKSEEKDETGSMMVLASKRKSLRLQHSMSLFIPMEELESSEIHMNCYIDLPDQIFSLTYLEVDNTQNPDTLQSLEVFKKRKWQAYLVGHLYNFENTTNSLNSLSNALNKALSSEYQNVKRDVTFQTTVVFSEDLSPTENDNPAIVIEVLQESENGETTVYRGYLVSWCNPIKEKGIFLPILLCSGSAYYQSTVNAVLSERLDVFLNKIALSQDELIHLSTYCLIMLNENDTSKAKFTYELPVGNFQIHQPVENLIRIWKTIHKEDTIEVDLDEVLLFHEEFELYVESMFGIVLKCVQFQGFEVSKCVSLHRNCQMKFNSTRIIHVVLKYLNYLAIKRLKLNVLGPTQEND